LGRAMDEVSARDQATESIATVDSSQQPFCERVRWDRQGSARRQKRDFGDASGDERLEAVNAQTRSRRACRRAAAVWSAWICEDSRLRPVQKSFNVIRKQKGAVQSSDSAAVRATFRPRPRPQLTDGRCAALRFDCDLRLARIANTLVADVR